MIVFALQTLQHFSYARNPMYSITAQILSNEPLYRQKRKQQKEKPFQVDGIIGNKRIV